MTLRWRRDPNAPALSRMWYRRWIEARPFLRKTTVKVVERDRKSFESADIANVEKFFSRLKELTEKHRIGASEIWNEDECGIRIGSVRERISVVVVRTTRHRRPEVIDPGNRESCTLIGAANAAGDVMPPWMVFKVFPSESWANVDGSGDIRFARSDTGFSNREITLDWIRHFNIQTFDEGFTRCNIISGFKKTGIWPTRSEPAVAKLLESQKKARRPVDPAYASLLPAQDRWQQSANVVRDVNERYHEVLSSPSRRGMARASQVMVEAQLLESNLRHSIQERDRRIEKVNNRLKRGKAVKPSGQFFANSVSLDQIRQQAQKTTEAEAKKEEKRQLRESQRILRREMETLRQQWRDDKVHEIDGKRKTLNFKQWLDLTKKADNYISLECNNKEYLQLLNMRDESFFVDAERRGQRPGLDEAIRKASQAAKPLTAFEFPPSDLSIEIFTQRPLEDNPGDDEDEFSSMHDPDEHHEHHDAIQYDGPAPASCKAHTHN
ncbi:hypothetical protein HIM_09504 [Hirsutella minnesotensis 3608]|uniref:DDE-1 domain-containing protein n=1 Tax=Hirsutella minnesotensis 3608 TaxID=1043627 RepID=A0A0F7ZLE0_9HYPO|nr:hypothetical protein HIM_09504 [Hirsutella minnesotensis 3608]